ncbi:MAG: RNA-binding protein [Verrucomicrobiaceae bacterium]|nr:RNA-binding protein [Verrucomicrobiaceae bacterium]
MNLYVSNLSYNLTDDELSAEFSAFGAVSSARVVKDRESGRSRGFGFVEMPNDAEAQAAINGLNNQNVDGRPMKVVEARPKEDRPQRRDFGSDRRAAGGNGGYNG